MNVAKKNPDVEKGASYKKLVEVAIKPVEVSRKQAEVVRAELKVAQLTEKMAPTRKEIRELNKQIDKLCAEVKKKTEERELDVYDEKDFAHREVRTRRCDNNKVVATRTMEFDERQEKLPIQVKPPEAAKEKPAAPDGPPQAEEPLTEAAPG